MANVVMKVSLPEELKKGVETLAEEGHYTTTSGYVQNLFRREIEKRAEMQRLEKIIERSLGSGISDQKPEEFFNELRSLIASKQTM